MLVITPTERGARQDVSIDVRGCSKEHQLVSLSDKTTARTVGAEARSPVDNYILYLRTCI